MLPYFALQVKQKRCKIIHKKGPFPVEWVVKKGYPEG